MTLLEEVHPEASQFFDFGLMQGQKYRLVKRESAVVISKNIMGCLKMARDLARAVPSNYLSEHWLKRPEEAIRYWQVGRDSTTCVSRLSIRWALFVPLSNWAERIST